MTVNEQAFEQRMLENRNLLVSNLVKDFGRVPTDREISLLIKMGMVAGEWDASEAQTLERDIKQGLKEMSDDNH